MRELFSYLFYPISIIYSLVMNIRNKLYDIELLESQKHSVLTIGVGNLRVGGTGKTPHVEHLISLLSKYYNVGVLSRGYGRKTKGFILLNDNNNVLEIGDEPLQIKNKFKNIHVGVCENRNKGIKEMEKIIPKLDIIILDDVFQHRSLDLDFSLLLTEYSKPYFNDKVIPFGNLREFKKGYKRADYIIVTKSPSKLSMGNRSFFESKLKPKKYQKLFYSNIIYKSPYHIFDNQVQNIELINQNIILLTGIADNTHIISYLQDKNASIIEKLEFRDHYKYCIKDIESLVLKYESQKNNNPIIVTTEKDSVKLINFIKLIEELPIYVLPISVNISYSDFKSQSFEEIFLEDVRKNKSFSTIYKKQD